MSVWYLKVNFPIHSFCQIESGTSFVFYHHDHASKMSMYHHKFWFENDKILLSAHVILKIVYGNSTLIEFCMKFYTLFCLQYVSYRSLHRKKRSANLAAKNAVLCPIGFCTILIGQGLYVLCSYYIVNKCILMKIGFAA